MCTARTLASALLFVALWVCTPIRGAESTATTVDYNRQIKPLLSNHCFKCHGPDAEQRKAGFRLDVRESALAAAESGERPIVAGQPAKSELVRRINSSDPDERMPPPSENKPLSDADKKKILWDNCAAYYAM